MKAVQVNQSRVKTIRLKAFPNGKDSFTVRPTTVGECLVERRRQSQLVTMLFNVACGIHRKP